MIEENGSVQWTNPHALMQLKHVCGLIGVSRSTLHRLREKDATVPAPIKDGETRQAPVYFVQAEVEGWIRRKMNGRQAANNETKANQLPHGLQLSRPCMVACMAKKRMDL